MLNISSKNFFAVFLEFSSISVSFETCISSLVSSSAKSFWCEAFDPQGHHLLFSFFKSNLPLLPFSPKIQSPLDFCSSIVVTSSSLAQLIELSLLLLLLFSNCFYIIHYLASPRTPLAVFYYSVCGNSSLYYREYLWYCPIQWVRHDLHIQTVFWHHIQHNGCSRIFRLYPSACLCFKECWYHSQYRKNEWYWDTLEVMTSALPSILSKGILYLLLHKCLLFVKYIICSSPSTLNNL